ncbi:hypothetical protein HDU79_003525, partial [Rhizoclosmatium sp. JEL0117]
MSVSQACNYTLTALQQQFSACGNGPNTNAVANCHCTALDPESVNAYCNFPESDSNVWTKPYMAAIDARMNACLAVNKDVVSRPVIALPSYISNPWEVQTGPLTPACSFILDAYGQRFRNCGKGVDSVSADKCICTGLYTESLLTYCDLPENDKSKWITDYQSGVSSRATSCAKVGLTVEPIPLVPLPNYIPNPFTIKNTPTPTTLTPACSHILASFNQRFSNCGKGADDKSAYTCICNGLFTESLLAYCDFPENDKSQWFGLYESGVTVRSESCAKVGLPLTPIPLLSLPDTIANPLKSTATTQTLAVAKTSAPSKPTNVIVSGAVVTSL